MPDGSTTVVIASAVANVAVATAKLVAGIFTRSSSMLTEAVHSFVDTADQVLLLVGQHRAARPPDETHPFGHGMEFYFWSLVVALLIFSIGGAASVLEGVRKLYYPEPVKSVWINYLILGFAFALESVSLWFGWREYRRTRRKDRAIWSFLRRSKDPAVMISIVENGADLVGLTFAFLGVLGNASFGFAWSDGVASIAIGVLLMMVAIFLVNETRSLLTGEAAPKPVIQAICEAVSSQPEVRRVLGARSLQLGPNQIVVALTVQFADGRATMSSAARLEQLVRERHEAVSQVYFRALPTAESS